MCKLCKTNPVYEFTNGRRICKGCFIKWFEKKVLYTLRRFGMIKKGDKISFSRTKDFRSVVLKSVLEMFVKRAPVEIVKSKANKMAVVDNVDLIAGEIAKILVKGDVSRLKIKPVEGKIIRPLYLFTDKEVLLYAKLRTLKFKKERQEKENILDTLEKRHPEIKHAVVQSYLKLNN